MEQHTGQTLKQIWQRRNERTKRLITIYENSKVPKYHYVIQHKTHRTTVHKPSYRSDNKIENILSEVCLCYNTEGWYS